MPFTVTMPKLSPTMEEGTVAKWHKREGEKVEAGDLLIEVATDKAVVEFNALEGGWLRQILVAEGKEALVNQAIAVMTEFQEESFEGYQPEGITPTLKVPTPLSSIQEEKAAEEAPRREKLMTTVTFSPEPPLEKYTFPKPMEAHQRLLASPLARRLAKERHLDLTTVKGTGPNQRIMSRDLEKAQPLGLVAFGRREFPQQIPGSYKEESLTPMRKVIAQRLQEAKSTIPHFYVSQTVQAEPLIQVRQQLHHFGIKLTYNDFIVRACALALRKHPIINSGFDSKKNLIVRFETIDICVAVSTPVGLITPIIRHADFKNLGELSLEIRSLAQRAKEGKLAPEEYKGGSFTVSNMGMYGITDFKAIINPPQAAILAISSILETPIVKEGNVIPGKVMNLTLSADHRVVDGAAGAEFLKTMKELLQNPSVLLIS